MGYSIACVVPGCERAAAAHGLCPRHLTATYRAIRAGKTSWAEQERQGLARPPLTLEQRRKQRKEIFRRPNHERRP